MSFDIDGYVLERIKYANTGDEAESFVKRIKEDHGNCIAVFESAASMRAEAEHALRKHGVPCKMANPKRLKMAQSGFKTDRIDAEKLANHLRMNDISESYLCPAKDRRIMDILNDRMHQVQDRTRIINPEHSILDKYDCNMSTAVAPMQPAQNSRTIRRVWS